MRIRLHIGHGDLFPQPEGSHPRDEERDARTDAQPERDILASGVLRVSLGYTLTGFRVLVSSLSSCSQPDSQEDNVAYEKNDMTRSFDHQQRRVVHPSIFGFAKWYSRSGTPIGIQRQLYHRPDIVGIPDRCEQGARATGPSR